MLRFLLKMAGLFFLTLGLNILLPPEGFSLASGITGPVLVFVGATLISPWFEDFVAEQLIS